MQRLRSHLSSQELKQRYLDSLDPIEAKRWYFLWQVSQSETVREVAMKMDINYDYALSLVRKYNRWGPIIVKDQRKVSWKTRSLFCQDINKNPIES